MPIRYLLLADIDLGSESSTALRLAVDLPSAVVGVPYTGALIASGGVAPYTYDDTPAGTIPPGLSINDTTGAVTGTPNTVGYYEFTAAVTDSNADTASQVVSIRVTSGIAVSNYLPDGEVGISYFAFFSATGGVAPYTFAVTSGSLPTSTSLSSGGSVTGTPSVAGTYNFTVTATDDNGLTQDLPGSITIAAALDLSASNYADGFVGVAYNAGPTVVGGVSPISYTFSGTLPTGTNFQPSTGFVTGAPTTPGTYAFDVTGLDALGATDTTSQSVDVTDGAGSGSQAAIQFEDEGSNLGTAGTVDELNFVGTNVTAARVGNKVTVTVSGSAVVNACGASFGNGSLLLSGTQVIEGEIPYGGTITEWTIVGDAVGSASIVVSHSTYANYDTMTTLFTATCTTAKKAQATGLSHSVSAGDVIRFSASGFSGFTRCTITLKVA